MPPRDRDSDYSEGSPNCSAGRCYKRVRIDGNAQAHLGDNHYYGSSEKDTDLDPVAKQNVILEHLYHTEMERRSISIHNLDQSACKWAFDPSKIPLRQWFEQEDGVFWITGKAGSGKSTFMKFLAQHPTTHDLLSTWAGTNRLILAEHYFWYSTPNNLQKNFEGMLRGLLYLVLHEIRDAIPTLLPGRWAQRGLRLRSAWTETELLNALRKLGTLQGVRFAFFLDGLDECIPSRDHGSLVRDLKELARNSNVKLCVSSRPWQTFEIHFGTFRKRVALHELTFPDMVAYVSSMLIKAELDTGLQAAFASHRSDADRLVEQIAFKAEGVFLWTVLIVRSLCQEIEAGRSVEDLQYYVDETPADLKTFFSTMVLERIDHRNQSAVARLLKCTTLLAKASLLEPRVQTDYHSHMSFLNFSVLSSNNEAEQEDFAFQAQIRPLDLIDMEAALQQTRRFLGHMSRDLLHIPLFEVNAGLEQLPKEDFLDIYSLCDYWEALACHRVEFLHRTVLDYLLDADVQSFLDRHIPSHFHRPDFVARVTLARLKLHPRFKACDVFPGPVAAFHWRLEDHECLKEYLYKIPEEVADFQDHNFAEYFGGAIVDLSPYTAVWHYAPNVPHDVDCCKARLPHVGSDLIAEYEEVALVWAMHAHMGPWIAFEFCMMLVSFGFTRYLRRQLTSCEKSLARGMIFEAIYTLFYYPTASSNTSMFATLLDHKETRETWHQANNYRQDDGWWRRILHYWRKLVQTGRLRTPRSELVYSEEMSTTLENDIFAIASTLCQHGHNVLQYPTWSETGSLTDSDSSTDASEERGRHESLFVALLNNADKKRVLKNLLANARSDFEDNECWPQTVIHT